MIAFHYLAPYTFIPLPWNGLQTPRTLSLVLWTGFFIFLSFSPVAFRSSSAFFKTSSGSMFLTQIAFSRPLM